jgi:hypothetical protein
VLNEVPRRVIGGQQDDVRGVRWRRRCRLRLRDTWRSGCLEATSCPIVRGCRASGGCTHTRNFIYLNGLFSYPQKPRRTTQFAQRFACCM